MKSTTGSVYFVADCQSLWDAAWTYSQALGLKSKPRVDYDKLKSMMEADRAQAFVKERPNTPVTGFVNAMVGFGYWVRVNGNPRMKTSRLNLMDALLTALGEDPARIIIATHDTFLAPLLAEIQSQTDVQVFVATFGPPPPEFSAFGSIQLTADLFQASK